MDSVLRPRDIQARIRSGESPETVAAAAQTSVDKIMGFATPVLAERAYVAQQAQRASVRRRGGDGPIGPLGEAVAGRLLSADLDPERVEWDAWRRDDGRWTLVADFSAAEVTKRAQFVYDMAGRYVVADDDESRWLVGERPAAAPAPLSPQTRVTEEDAAGDPSAAVLDEQLPLGEDAIALVTGSASGTGPAAHGIRSAEQRSDQGADWISTQASPRPTAPEEQEPADTLFDTGEIAGVAPESAEPPEKPDPDRSPEEEPTSAKPGRPRGRASVPSWDEIMFGSNQKE